MQINVTSKLGGGSQHMYLLIKGLINSDRYRIVAICPNDGPYFWKLQALGIEVIDLPIRTYSFKVAFELLKIVRREKIHVIHSHGKGAGMYSRPLGILTGIPVVHTFHGLHYHTYHELTRRSYLWIERVLGSFTAEVINVSKGEQDEAFKLGILQRHKGVVIYNGVDVNLFDNITANPSQKREELSIEKGTFLIGTVARISVQKGLEYLLQGLHILSYRIPNFKCLIIGDVPFGEERLQLYLLNRMQELGLQEHVVFMGPRLDVRALLEILDLYVSCSLWEGLPIALIEAMACRKAIVATDVVGNNEVVVDGETGFLVPSRDPESLARKMAQLLQNYSLREKFGEKGRRRAESYFSSEEMVRATEEVYRTVLGGYDDKDRSNYQTLLPMDWWR
jgi:glycosyltransferase involved in cell wall biosynthesis